MLCFPQHLLEGLAHKPKIKTLKSSFLHTMAHPFPTRKSECFVFYSRLRFSSYSKTEHYCLAKLNQTDRSDGQEYPMYDPHPRVFALFW